MIPRYIIESLDHKKLERSIRYYRKFLVSNIEIKENKNYLIMMDGVGLTRQIHKLNIDEYFTFYEVVPFLLKSVISSKLLKKYIKFIYFVNDEFYFYVNSHNIDSAYKLVSYFVSAFTYEFNKCVESRLKIKLPLPFLFDVKLYDLDFEMVKKFIEMRQDSSILCNLEHLTYLNGGSYDGKIAKAKYLKGDFSTYKDLDKILLGFAIFYNENKELKVVNKLIKYIYFPVIEEQKK